VSRDPQRRCSAPPHGEAEREVEADNQARPTGGKLDQPVDDRIAVATAFQIHESAVDVGSRQPDRFRRTGASARPVN
jgi:hypothetical protein